MLQLDAQTWQKIAAQTGGFQTPFGKKYLTLDQAQMTAAHQKLADNLKQQKLDPQVITAYLEMAPLLAEREAISIYARKHPQIREAIPEVLSTDEAVLIATSEHRLNINQATQLGRKLSALEMT